jgi:hypothetical protein
MLRTPDRERAFAALDQGIVFEYAAGTKGAFLTLLGLSGNGSDPSVRYLAHLFLGADAERRGAGNEAEALYRAALADLPAGQSLYLALAHLSDNRGNRGDANEMLASFRRRAIGNRLADPWWDYFNVDGIGFDAVTAWRTLRAEVLK